MITKYKALVVAIPLAVSGSSAFAKLASCGSGTTALSAGSTELFGNSFTSAQRFSDCYSFSIGDSSDALGGTLTIDPLSLLDVRINSITLSSGGSIIAKPDKSPGEFSFSDLIAGTYQLVVSGLVTKGNDLTDVFRVPVGYGGWLKVNAVSPVPEPQAYAMALVGLGIVGWAVRRRKQV